MRPGGEGRRKVICHPLPNTPRGSWEKNSEKCMSGKDVRVMRRKQEAIIIVIIHLFRKRINICFVLILW